MFWLACTDGADKGMAIKLGEEPVLIGRQVDCDMQLKEKCASRHHCRLTLNDRRLTVEDLGSSNGIKFNGKRLKGESFKIWPSQGFRIGDDEFVFSDELELEKNEVIDLSDHAEEPATPGVIDNFGDSSNLLSAEARKELAEAAKKAKRQKTRNDIGTKTVWERISSVIRRDK